MMKHINIKRTAIITVSVFLFSACDIEPELTDRYTDEVPWTSTESMNLYLNNLYPLVGGYATGMGNDLYSDILKANSPVDEANLFVFGKTTISPESNIIGGWGWAYTWIRQIHEFLQGLHKYSENLDPEEALRAEAQARFFRAYVYFDLAKKFGGSVILLKDLPTDGYQARCEPDECWNFIAEDLDFAAKHLPKKWSEIAGYTDENNLGRLTKGAAHAMKARAMLYAKRWKAASDACDSVMSSGVYHLYGELASEKKNNPADPSDNAYASVFKFKRKDGRINPESIIESGHQTPNFGYSFDYFYCPPGDKGYAQVSPTEDLVESYEMADGRPFSWSDEEMKKNPYEGREPRFYASILYNGASWKEGRKIETFVKGTDGWAYGGSTTCTGYYLRKLFDETIKIGVFDPGELTDYKIRFAEVLLIYAEAMAEQNKINPEAIDALNRVRARVNLPALSATNKTQFMDYLRQERKVELAFEGHRYWDLRRWGLATSVLNDVNCRGTKIVKNSDGTFTYTQIDCDSGNKRKYQKKYNCFPIPLDELQNNPLCEQFPEWK